MSEQSSAIISKVWGMCSPLRDDGVGYGDYLEQLTYLIFLKMSDEYSKPPYKKQTRYSWTVISASRRFTAKLLWAVKLQISFWQ